MLRLTLLSAVLAASLGAQGGAPTFVPKPGLASFAAEDVPRLREQLPQSAVGRLLADAEVAAAWDRGLQRYRERAARRDATMTAAIAMDLELPPWLATSVVGSLGWSALRELDLQDLQRVEYGGVLLEGDDVPRWSPVAGFATFSCRPRAEGRWSAIFERHARALTASKVWQTDPDVKFAGFPAYGFRAAPRVEGGNEQLIEQYGDARAWLLHLPGLFAFGSTTPERCGTLAPPPPRAPAQVVGEMDLAAYATLFSQLGGRIPAEFAALGFTGLKSLRWRGRFVGTDVLDEFEAELGDEPKGLVGALLAGKAALPGQPLPDGALAQLRAAIDLPTLLSVADILQLGEVLPEALRTVVGKAFTGGLALGACAPAGGLIPRIYLSLGIADAKALDELLAKVVDADVTKKEVTYEGVTCTVLTISRLPAAFRPTYCTIDGVLHVAESALSMRAFLKARLDGGEAMAIGDVPVPAGGGELLPTLDMRCDEQALYRTFHKVWLPLVKLMRFDPLLQPDEMPSPDAVLPLLGRSRGVLRRQGKTWRLQQQGPLGGVETAGLAMTWGPIVSSFFHRDYYTDEVSGLIAKKKLEAVWTSLEAFQKEQKRWPNDLAELVVASKLPADALLLPGDGLAEAVPMPAGDARGMKSSFRYFKDGVKVDVQGNAQTMLLIAIAPCSRGRSMLANDGTIPDVYGDENRWPIDRFGK